MTPVRIGVIGGGFGAYGHVPALRRCPGVYVAGIWSRTAGRAVEMAQRFGVRALTGDPRDVLCAADWDAVVISTPTALQEALIPICLDRGLPVVAAKPLALDGPTARRFAEQAARRGVPTAMDFLFPEIDAFQVAKRAVTSGVIGTPTAISIRWLFQSHDVLTGKIGWKSDPCEGGGVMGYFGSHSLHMLSWFDSPIVEIMGRVAGAPHLAPAETLAHLSARLRSGVDVSVMLNAAAPGFAEHRIDLIGSTGAISLCAVGPDPTAFTFIGPDATADLRASCPAIATGDTARVDDEDPRVAPLSRLLNRFVKAVRGDAPYEGPDLQDGAIVQTHIDAVRTQRNVFTTTDAASAQRGDY